MVEDDQIQNRLREIETRGQEIKKRRLDNQWIPSHDLSFVWWTYWETSGYVVLPFAGALADQPNWLMADYAGFNEIAEHEELVYEYERLKKRQSAK